MRIRDGFLLLGIFVVALFLAEIFRWYLLSSQNRSTEASEKILLVYETKEGTIIAVEPNETTLVLDSDDCTITFTEPNEGVLVWDSNDNNFILYGNEPLELSHRAYAREIHEVLYPDGVIKNFEFEPNEPEPLLRTKHCDHEYGQFNCLVYGCDCWLICEKCGYDKGSEYKLDLYITPVPNELTKLTTLFGELTDVVKSLLIHHDSLEERVAKLEAKP